MTGEDRKVSGIVAPGNTPPGNGWCSRTLTAAPWLAAMICSYLLLNEGILWPYLGKIWGHHPPAHVIRYLLLFAVNGIGFGVALMSLHRRLLFPAYLLLAVIVTVNSLARDMLDLKVVGDDSAEWLLSETAQAADAISAFPSPIAHHLMVAIAMLAPSVFIARLARRRFRLQLKPVLWGFCALFIYALGDAAAYHYDRPYFPVESNLLVYDALFLLKPDPNIAPIDMHPVRQSAITKIVLVVDESVTYRTYVDVLRDRWSRWNGVDYGEAASLANCSAASNSMLRWGFRATRMLAGEDPRLAPTIWSYAHGAGFETWLIDGQRGGSYQNYMRGKEAALIDHYVGVSSGMETDRSIAELLHTVLLRPGRQMLYVNKAGAHFPYKDKYPADRASGAQTLEQQNSSAVRYSTQDFLDVMLRGVPIQQVMIVYTSDHGEQFTGTGSPHCNANPAWQEFSVPLLLISGDQTLAQPANSVAAVLRNRVNHARIFPTLLNAMGYDRSSAEAEYGPSLLSENTSEIYFRVGPNPIPGRARESRVTSFAGFPYRQEAQHVSTTRPSTAGTHE